MPHTYTTLICKQSPPRTVNTFDMMCKELLQSAAVRIYKAAEYLCIVAFGTFLAYLMAGYRKDKTRQDETNEYDKVSGGCAGVPIYI